MVPFFLLLLFIIVSKEIMRNQIKIEFQYVMNFLKILIDYAIQELLRCRINF